jgi:hypothetical protein
MSARPALPGNVEPEFVSAKGAAAVLAISERAFLQIVGRGDIVPVRVPGFRRVLFSLSDVRRLADCWRRAGGTQP